MMISFHTIAGEKNNNFDIDYLDDGEGETESSTYSLSGASWIEGFF